MSHEAKTAQGSAATVESKIKFKDMNGKQKLVHVSKVIIFVVSFGFAFPQIFSD